MKEVRFLSKRLLTNGLSGCGFKIQGDNLWILDESFPNFNEPNDAKRTLYLRSIVVRKTTIESGKAGKK